MIPALTTHTPPTPAARAWQALEHAFDRPFGGSLNPLRQLGALGFLCLWLLAATGVVLYALLDTSARGAYGSVEALAHWPWRLGSALRGLHRHAADAFVVVMGAHLLREAMLGRFRGFRSFSWTTGVPPLLLVFVCGIGGFWLNWDRLAQYSATATAEWLDALPLFAAPLARNFLGAAPLGDRLFSLFVFVHLGAPLLLVFALWFHVQRISHAAVFPPRALAAGTTLALLALAWLAPVLSQGPARLDTQPGPLALDWLLLFLHPLTEATSARITWALLLAALLALLTLPWWSRRAPAPAAVVDAAHCNGCRRCVDDCPYAAITMQPHPSGRRGAQVAQVDADLCASCGLCAGACPSATPFRRDALLASGIDMPQLPVDRLRTRLRDGLAALAGPRRFVVFGCDHGARTDALAAPDVLCLGLPCIGLLPPAFVDFALRHGASGVLVAGCREGGCAFRLGQRWTLQRLRGMREPALRRSVPATRWQLAWADAGDEDRLRAGLLSLRDAASASASATATAPAPVTPQ